MTGPTLNGVGADCSTVLFLSVFVVDSKTLKGQISYLDSILSLFDSTSILKAFLWGGGWGGIQKFEGTIALENFQFHSFIHVVGVLKNA